MHNIYKKLTFFLISFIVITLSSISPAFATNDSADNFRFKRLSAFDDLPSEEVTQIIQDNNGYIWIATNSGLCRYDGYRIQTFKDYLITPKLLSSNEIKSIAEDYDHNIWIGTNNGLNFLNMKTGKISAIADNAIKDKTVNAVSVGTDNTIWMGLSDGIYRYFPKTATMKKYSVQSGDQSLFGIITIFCDSQGGIWAGTWSLGLFKYDGKGDNFISYPRISDRNSAHCIFEDSRHRIWLGSWGDGLFRVENHENLEKIRYVNYRNSPNNPGSLSDNIVYRIEEEPGSNTLWIGTRSGLSILNLNNLNGSFVNYLPESKEHPLPYNEVDAIARDHSGMMWVGMMGGGVYSVNTRPSLFKSNALSSVKDILSSNSVRSMFIDSEQTLWMGIGSIGLVYQKPDMLEPALYTANPVFRSQIPYIHTVNEIAELSTKREVWFATWGYGLYIYSLDPSNHNIRKINKTNSPWLADDCIFSMKEDRDGNMWLGCSGGVSVMKSDGNGININDINTHPDSLSLNQIFYVIEQTPDGSMFMGTNQGVIRIQGNISKPETLRFKLYDTQNQNLPFERIQCLKLDSRQNLWAGSEGGGLTLYNKTSDSFESVNRRYNIPSDIINSIQSLENGDLWLGTNSGLIWIKPTEDYSKASIRIYTKTDGLLDNYFIRSSIARDNNGKLYFGGHNGYSCFNPDSIHSNDVMPNVVITNLYVNSVSLTNLTQKERTEISPLSPEYAQKITLNHRRNNFSIEFSALCFANPSQNKYAYMLEGYDTDWKYTGASNRTASYNNLPSGTYTFRLKGSNENGLWGDQQNSLRITILPPPWKTLWAYTIYVVLFILLTFMVVRIIRNRMLEKRAREYRKLEIQKAEEINHAKLQFFTNITHEFLAPLSIISASLDELKKVAPETQEYYPVMSNNLNRLVRLLQQILEFRKAESGNLKLTVSKGDVAAFIKSEIDAFRPLIKKKKMELTFVSEPESIVGYFDQDKVDKILYNLMSNVAKYNKDECRVEVTVTYAEPKGILVFSVADNGQGMTQEVLQNLFVRFYEGGNRKFSASGTGIGMSLTKDLVILHKGEIDVHSQIGQGTKFTVSLPVTREAFAENQIDDSETIIISNDTQEPEFTAPTNTPKTQPESEQNHSLLIVEDSEELLELMVKLLSHEYTIFTATNGKAAIPILESEDIDMVVSDIVMPEMNGIELCHHIKNNPDICHIPVMLLTGKDTEEARIEAYESGAEGYLNKPFNLSLLHARIKNLLKSKERTARDFKKQLVFEAKELNYTSLDEDFLKRAIECVQRHLSDVDFEQQQLIEELATSKSTLYKKLKSLTGLNTSAFIRNVRLKAACQIIEDKGQLRISELAYAVGFNDPKYFSACFKKEFGLLPTDYIERYATNK